MTDREKINAIRAEVQNYIDAARKAHTNITEGNFAHLLSFIDSLQEEPMNEDLEKAAEDYSNNLDNIYGSIGKQTRYAFKAGAQWQRDQILNCNATLLRTFELGKIEMKHQILKAMDLGEPPYLISVEKAYYDVKKLLEDEV